MASLQAASSCRAVDKGAVRAIAEVWGLAELEVAAITNGSEPKQLCIEFICHIKGYTGH